jgi:hypothetical protein
MKLRCKPNSVRFRLNQTEVAKFAQTGEIIERIEFPGQIDLVYGLRFSSDLPPGRARFESGELIVIVPRDHVVTWAESEKEIGLYYEQECEGGRSLRVAIEKDFQCIDGPLEEIDPAGYPNPLATIGCGSEAN